MIIRSVFVPIRIAALVATDPPSGGWILKLHIGYIRSPCSILVIWKVDVAFSFTFAHLRVICCFMSRRSRTKAVPIYLLLCVCNRVCMYVHVRACVRILLLSSVRNFSLPANE